VFSFLKYTTTGWKVTALEFQYALVNAIWNFFESGHGKGPFDGIGGTYKRIADLAIRQGKITIQDAPEYFERTLDFIA
jgi:hypothetical protein